MIRASNALCLVGLMLLRHVYAEHRVASRMGLHDGPVIVLLRQHPRQEHRVPQLPHQHGVLCNLLEVRERVGLVLEVLEHCGVVGEVVQARNPLAFPVAAPQIVHSRVEGRYLLDVCRKLVSGQPGQQRNRNIAEERRLQAARPTHQEGSTLLQVSVSQHHRESNAPPTRVPDG